MTVDKLKKIITEPKFMKNFIWVFISLFMITVGTSWVANELEDSVFDKQAWNLWQFLVGLALALLGTLVAKIIAREISKPDANTFKPIIDETKDKVLAETQVVFMGLSENKASLEAMNNYSWQEYCGEESIKDEDGKYITWQQNIRVMNQFVKHNPDVKFVIICTKETESRYKEFESFITQLAEKDNIKLTVSKAKKSIDVETLDACSKGIKQNLVGYLGRKCLLDITSATKQYTAACTLETSYLENMYLGYVTARGGYFLYNVLNEERGEVFAG